MFEEAHEVALWDHAHGSDGQRRPRHSPGPGPGPGAGAEGSQVELILVVEVVFDEKVDDVECLAHKDIGPTALLLRADVLHVAEHVVLGADRVPALVLAPRALALSAGGVGLPNVHEVLDDGGEA